MSTPHEAVAEAIYERDAIDMENVAMPMAHARDLATAAIEALRDLAFMNADAIADKCETLPVGDDPTPIIDLILGPSPTQTEGEGNG